MKGKNLKRIIAFIMVFAMIITADAAMLATVFAEAQKAEMTEEEPGEPVGPVKPVEPQETEEEPEPKEEVEEPEDEEEIEEQEPKEEERPADKPEGEKEEEIEEPEEEEEEEIVEEAMTLTLESEGVTIEVSAEAGVLPEGTQIRVNPLSDDEIDMYLNAIEEQKEDILMGYASLFDIELLDADGNVIQPDGEVKVSFYGLDHIKEDDDAFIYHVEQKNTAAGRFSTMSTNNVDIEDFDVEVESGKISFDTDHFSIYIVGTNTRHDESWQNRYQMYVGDTVELEERDSRNDGSWTIDSGSSNAEVVSSSGRNATIEATNIGNATVRYSVTRGGPNQNTYFYIRVNARGSHDDIDPAVAPVTDPDALDPGTVAAEKTAKWVDYGNRIAEINLSVEGMPVISGSDVILIMDVSRSMETGNRINTARAASNEFVNNLLEDGNPLNNRVAFIPFHGSRTGGTGQSEVNNVTSGRVNFSYDMDRLTSHISSVPVGTYTNYSAALAKAIDYSNSRIAGEKSRPLYIVFMSDGEPNPGSSNGVSQANTLKGPGHNATIYTVGIQLTGSAPSALQNLSSTVNGQKLYQNVSNMGDLANVLDTIAGQTKIAGTNAVFKDIIADEFEFYNVEPYFSNGTYNSSNRTVTIEVNDINEAAKTYKIYVQLKQEFRLTEDSYKTNKDIGLDYTDVDGESANKGKEIGDPSVSVGFGTINVRYVLVNDSGQYINAQGTVVDEAFKHSVGSHLFMHNGSTQLEPDETYTVSPTVPSGYNLYSGEAASKQQALTVDDRNATVEFKVVKSAEANYKVEHYQENLTGSGYTLKDTDDLTGAIGATVNATAKSYTGFTENTAHSDREASGTVLADGNLVLKLFYDRDLLTVTFFDWDDDLLKTEQVRYGGDATPPTNPSRTGYTFDGWDGNYTNVIKDETVKAKYLENEDAGYKVEHYLQDLGQATYSMDSNVDELNGKTGELTAAVARNYEGFTVASFDQETIAADGSTVVKIFYDRNIYTLTYKDSLSDEIYVTQNYKFEETISVIDDPTKSEYIFNGWEPVVPGTMPANNLTVEAQWALPPTGPELQIVDYNGVYDGEAHNISILEESLVDGDKIFYRLSTDSGWSENLEFTNVGVNEVLVKVVNRNFQDRFGTGTVTITKRPITITTVDDSKVYDGSLLTNHGYNITSGTLVTGQEEDVEVTGSIRNIGSLPNSIGQVKILDGDIDVTSNYEISKTAGTLTITPKEIVITVNDAEKVFGEEDPIFTGTVTGLINDYDLILSGYSRTNDDENVGVYEDVLIPEFTVSSNYTVTVNKGNFTITKAIGEDLITEDYEGIYDGDPHSIEVLNTIEGDTVFYKVGNGNWTTTNPGFTNVGEYDVEVKVENKNYEDRLGTGTVKITARPITVAANDDSKVYNGLPLINLGHQITSGSLVDGQNSVAVVLGGRIDAGESQNELRSVMIFDGLRNVTKNYDITKENGTLTVTARPITVTANSASKVYDGNPLSDSGFEITSGDMLRLHRAQASVTGSIVNVGTEDNIIGNVEIRGPFGIGNFTNNYEITLVDGVLEVTKATGAELAIEDYEGIYDGDPHSIVVTNTIDGDKVFYRLDEEDDWSEEKPEFTDVGEYKVLVKVENPNYEDRLGEGLVNITPKSVTIVVNNASKRVGQSDPEFTGTVEGLINDGDLGDIVYSRTNADINSVGVYPEVLRAEFEDNPNYTVEITKGNFTITSAPTPGPGPTPVPPELNDPEEPPELNLEDHFAYIQGYPDNTVKPEGLVSREEVAAVFYRLLTDESRNALMATSNNFPDVASSRWSNRHISTLTNGGIIQGYNDGTFKPGSSITRAELATIASRFDNLSLFTGDRFSDIGGHWANQYINSAAEKGWVNGYPDGTFRPNQAITRAEFVTLVNAVLERRVHKENILEDARVFPDLSESAWYYEAMQEAINSHTYVRLEDGYEEWIEIYYPELDM